MRHETKLENLLEALEDEFNLPSASIKFEDGSCVERFTGKRRKDEDEVRGLQGPLVMDLLLFLGRPERSPFRLRSEWRREAERHNTSLDGLVLENGELHAPVANLSHAKSSCMSKGLEPLAICIGE